VVGGLPLHVPRIAILSRTVADQIAAGEVVERPASVVKELLDNALDAGASLADITIEDGGRTLIRVSDDGCGMDREDALLALERHGTSKIRALDDLSKISTFGFRGEALPAICSVSELELDTAAGEAEGTLVRARGGQVSEVRDSARRRGTTVTVSRLFYNVPARLKFLRSSKSEWRAIVDTVSAIALSRPDLRLTLSQDGRKALTLPPASTLRARLAGLWGGRYAERMVEVDDVSGVVHVSGLVERPGDVGTATRRTYLSINGRAVRDAGIVRAAETAYRSTIPAGVRPSLFLDIVLSVDSVDVNVHPAKAEVRFRDRWGVERAVEAAVRRALGTGDSAASFGSFRAAFTPSPSVPVWPTPIEIFSGGPSLNEMFGVSAGGEQTASTVTAPTAPVPDPEADLPTLTQFRRTYIAFEHEDGLVLIDQHSAHERVLYERFLHTLESGSEPSQQLLFPLTLHLGPTESDAFEENREYLERLGFEVEGFGGNTLIIRSVPMPHPRFDAAACLRDTLDALTGDRVAGTAARHERLAATVACKAAIKAGDVLSQQEMRSLLHALRDTALPAHDVHGRSTIVQLPWNEVDRRFGRQ
jgi:DNA mismatch repair protein MutL